MRYAQKFGLCKDSLAPLFALWYCRDLILEVMDEHPRRSLSPGSWPRGCSCGLPSIWPLGITTQGSGCKSNRIHPSTPFWRDQHLVHSHSVQTKKLFILVHLKRIWLNTVFKSTLSNFSTWFIIIKWKNYTITMCDYNSWMFHWPKGLNSSDECFAWPRSKTKGVEDSEQGLTVGFSGLSVEALAEGWPLQRGGALALSCPSACPSRSQSQTPTISSVSPSPAPTQGCGTVPRLCCAPLILYPQHRVFWFTSTSHRAEAVTV